MPPLCRPTGILIPDLLSGTLYHQMASGVCELDYSPNPCEVQCPYTMYVRASMPGYIRTLYLKLLKPILQ